MHIMTQKVHNIQKNYFEPKDDQSTKWISESEFQFSSLGMKLLGWLMPAPSKTVQKYMEDFKSFAENGTSVSLHNEKGENDMGIQGPNSKETAKHHILHLEEYLNMEQIKDAEVGVEDYGVLQSNAYLIVDENYMTELRNRLKPHRGQWHKD